MKVLTAPTEEFNRRERTQLAANASAGSSVVVTVANVADFSVNDYVVVGLEGSQQAELTQVTAIFGQTLTLALLTLAHELNEPVVKYRYNQRRFYGSTSATGSFLELTSSGSPLTIMVNDPQGTTLEYTGLEGYTYFKATYFNSTTNDTTDLANSDAVLADESLRYCSIYAIRRQAGLTNNPYITDGDIEAYRKRAENEVDSWLSAKFIMPYTNASGIEEIPAVLENITMLLAAGYMDYREYGRDGQGVKWLGEARAILKALQGPGGQTLIGSDHLEMQVVTNSQSVVGYPDIVDDECGPPQFFTMTQKF